MVPDDNGSGTSAIDSVAGVFIRAVDERGVDLDRDACISAATSAHDAGARDHRESGSSFGRFGSWFALRTTTCDPTS
jgi:hypothetical protein